MRNRHPDTKKHRLKNDKVTGLNSKSQHCLYLSSGIKSLVCEGVKGFRLISQPGNTKVLCVSPNTDEVNKEGTKSV